MITGVFGLHDLPLPRRPQPEFPGEPAKVTPAVLASTYSIADVKPTGSLKNIMHVTPKVRKWTFVQHVELENYTRQTLIALHWL